MLIGSHPVEFVADLRRLGPGERMALLGTVRDEEAADPEAAAAIREAAHRAAEGWSDVLAAVPLCRLLDARGVDYRKA